MMVAEVRAMFLRSTAPTWEGSGRVYRCNSLPLQPILQGPPRFSHSYETGLLPAVRANTPIAASFAPKCRLTLNQQSPILLKV
jgi:hypothetical protein